MPSGVFCPAPLSWTESTATWPATSSITPTTTAPNTASGRRRCASSRDLYVYLPPGYDPCKKYPLILWLHGFGEDEHSFLTDGVRPLDRAMRTGVLPPAIVAAPDGSLKGVSGYLERRQLLPQHAGRRPLRGLPDAGRVGLPLQPLPHPAGARGPRHRRRVDGRRRRLPHGHQVPGPLRHGGGVHPAVERALGGLQRPYIWPNFDPNCWGWRTEFNRGLQVVGRYYLVFTVRERWSASRSTAATTPTRPNWSARENPIEMLDAYDVRDGEFNMYIAYAGRDNFTSKPRSRAFSTAPASAACTSPWTTGRAATTTRRRCWQCCPNALNWLGPKLAAVRAARLTAPPRSAVPILTGRFPRPGRGTVMQLCKVRRPDGGAAAGVLEAGGCVCWAGRTP